MFKNLFNNAWFVGALGAFATIYLGWVVAAPLFMDNPGADAADIGVDIVGWDLEPGMHDSVERSSTSLTPQRQGIRWLDEVERDPFAGMAYATPDDPSGSPGLPKLEALFISQGVKAAVVANQLVYVGDRVSHYTVTDIGDGYVELSRSNKAFRLTPEV